MKQPNAISASVDQSFKESISVVVNEILEKHGEVFYNNKDRLAKLIKTDTRDWLFYKNGTTVSVYESNSRQKYNFDSFQYSKDSMAKDAGEIYTQGYVLSFRTTESFSLQKLLDTLGETLEQVAKKVGLSEEKMKAMLNQDSFHTTSSPENLWYLTEFLFEQGLLEKQIPQSYYEQLCLKHISLLEDKTTNMLIDMRFLKEQSVLQKFTASKPYVFNDLDNNVWKHTSGFFMTDQNIGFYVKFNSPEDIVVYAYSQEYKRLKSKTQLLNALKESTINKLEDVSLIIEKGQVVYYNPGEMECFELDLKYSAQSIEKKYQVSRAYPTNVKDYDYQLQFYSSQYDYDEFAFLVQAFLTLGGGFNYDKKEGVLYDNLAYIPNLKPAVRYQGEKVEKINYASNNTLKDITYLNADWKARLELLINTLERDRPHVLASHNSEADLDNCIKEGRAVLAKLDKKESVKPK